MLEQELKLPSDWLRKNSLPIAKAIQERPVRLSLPSLLALGNWAIVEHDRKLGYQASVVGLLSATGVMAARFLLLRAKSFFRYNDRRISQCLRAASELARQANDTELVAEISAWARLDPFASNRLGSGSLLGAELLAEILKREREADQFSDDPNEIERYVVAIDDERRRPVFDVFGHDDRDDEDDDWEEDEEDWDEEDSEDDFDLSPIDRTTGMPRGLPPSAKPIVDALIKKYGRLLTPSELMEKEPDVATQLIGLMTGIDFSSDAVKKVMGDIFGKSGKKPPGPGKGKR